MVLYLDSVGNVTDLICHKVQAELFILTLLFETISVYELIMLLYRASVQLIRFVIIWGSGRSNMCFFLSFFSLRLMLLLKPVLNWANICLPEHTSDTLTNYDSFLNWTFSSPNMVRTVQTLLHSQLACNEMQASARTCGICAADRMIENVG